MKSVALFLLALCVTSTLAQDNSIIYSNSASSSDYGTYQFAVYADLDACVAALKAGPLVSTKFPADNTCQTDSAWPASYISPLNKGTTVNLTVPQNFQPPWSRYPSPVGSFQGYCTDSQVVDTTNYYATTDKFMGTFYANGFDPTQDTIGAAVSKTCGVFNKAQRVSTWFSNVPPKVNGFMVSGRSNSCQELMAPTGVTNLINPLVSQCKVSASASTNANALCQYNGGTLGFRLVSDSSVSCSCDPSTFTNTAFNGMGPALGYIAVQCNRRSQSSTCFPSDATVELKDGSLVRMDSLKVGQNVRVAAKEHSEVFMFSHMYADALATFVELKTEQGAIRLTADHYIYVNGLTVRAGSVKVGDLLETAEGKTAVVTGISSVRATGLYNPHTMQGDIVVNGFRTTTYTEAINPTLAHALLAPVRAMYNMNVTTA